MTAMTQLEHPPARVVVVGAGFAGLAAVRRLRRTGMATTLVDRNLYATFQPLLYQVATAGLTSGDVAYPARAAAHRHHASFRHGDLTGIDPAARQVLLADGTSVGYDYLILATGVSAAHHGIPGAAEHTLGLYTRRDAIALRDRIMAELDRISLNGRRCRSSPSRPCRWADTPPIRSAGLPRDGRPRRSATATRASWPPSGTAPRSSSSPSGCGSEAPPPGSPGSRCT